MMMFGLLPWFFLMIAGLLASVALLFWGHRSGQFADQDRARYLPLRDEETRALNRESAGMTREVYVLAGLMAAAGISLALALGLAVLKQYGG